ncbi:uncharacterized protein LOC119646859 [Hermetia illucens]|uniref:uncharacterized protein LOC119646859 n=1 Tax=Hermetia illucens TaxID=343691 RepID=UPI0018CBFF8B|nr:uncharacterized protein LOC119646859 [Hermetia illucens]
MWFHAILLCLVFSSIFAAEEKSLCTLPFTRGRTQISHRELPEDIQTKVKQSYNGEFICASRKLGEAEVYSVQVFDRGYACEVAFTAFPNKTSTWTVEKCNNGV